MGGFDVKLTRQGLGEVSNVEGRKTANSVKISLWMAYYKLALVIF